MENTEKIYFNMSRLNNAVSNKEKKCYICEEAPYKNSRVEVGGKDPHQLKTFKLWADESEIYFSIKDIEYAYINLSCCEKHLPNLNKLELSVKNNDKHLTEEMLKESLE